MEGLAALSFGWVMGAAAPMAPPGREDSSKQPFRKEREWTNKTLPWIDWAMELMKLMEWSNQWRRVCVCEWGPKELTLRGKRENGIQWIDGVRTALQFMDEMNGGAGFLFLQWMGYRPEAHLPHHHFIPQTTFASLRLACPFFSSCSPAHPASHQLSFFLL